MLVYENECVGCPSNMGCLGSACPHRSVPHYYCDNCECEYEPDELHDVEGQMICRECLFEMFPKIKTEG